MALRTLHFVRYQTDLSSTQVSLLVYFHENNNFVMTSQFKINSGDIFKKKDPKFSNNQFLGKLRIEFNS